MKTRAEYIELAELALTSGASASSSGKDYAELASARARIAEGWIHLAELATTPGAPSRGLTKS